MKTKSFIAFIIAVFVLCSCNENSQIVESPTLPNSNKINFAIFSSQNSLDNSIKDFQEKGILPSEIQKITSLSQQKLKSSESDNTESNNSLIHSEILKHFLNENNEIAIGEVFFRITELGTFFTPIKNWEWLHNLEISESLLLSITQTTHALGYEISDEMYQLNNFDKLFFYDTYRKLNPLDQEVIFDNNGFKSTSVPNESEWKDVDDGKTLVGKFFDSIWGFTKKREHEFDSDHRVQVKFYAQRFPFYSEMGITTRAEKKGTLGIWRNQRCDEIIIGWDMLNLEEKWPGSMFGNNLDPHNNFLPEFKFEDQVAKDLAYNQSVFLDKEWRTFNILGLELDFSQKDKVKALWNVCKNASKISARYLNGYQSFSDTDQAIRLIPKDASKAKISLSPTSKRRDSSEEFTMVIANSSGGTIGIKLTNYSDFGFSSYQNLSAKYKFLDNTVMYGAVRRGDTWRGIRINF